MQRNPNDPWIRPTLLGAAFDAGDVPQAKKLLDVTARPHALSDQIARNRRAGATAKPNHDAGNGNKKAVWRNRSIGGHGA